MKNITIGGRLGKDAVLRTAGSGQVCSFSVAVDDRSGREKATYWFDVSLWGKRGEAIARYLTKGTQVAVSGDFRRREYEGKTYLEVNASDVTLMGGGERQDRRDDAPATAQSGSPTDDDFDGIPF